MNNLSFFRNICFEHWNPFRSRIAFCSLSIIICWYMAIHYHAMYQTMDDLDIRMLVEGSIGGQLSEPSEFTLYTNVLYGKFLKFFYTIYRDGYWYDIFNYLFISVSLFVIILSVYKNFEFENVGTKIFKLAVITLVGATPFISPQWTIVSGLLAISGVLSFYMWVDEYFTHRKAQTICAVYCVIALLFSSLIRFECCLVVGFFTGVLLLPCWPYKDWKKHLKKCIITIAALLSILGAYFLDNHIVSQHPAWNEARKANKVRAELVDTTNAWHNLSAPWKGTKDVINKLADKKDVNFSNADYRMLFAAAFLGNNLVNTSDNLEKVYEYIKDSINKINLKYNTLLEDYISVIPSFVILVSILFCLSLTLWKKNLFCVSCFIILVICLSIITRTLPYRLWYNFSLITIAIMLMNLKNINILNKNIYLKILIMLFFFVGIKQSYTIMHHQANTTKYQYKIYSRLCDETKILPKDKIYISYYALQEYAACPFKKHILNNIIIPSPLSFHESHKKFFEEKGIFYDNFWEEVCNRDSKIRLLYRSDIYDGGWSTLKKAIPYYIYEKHGKQVAYFYQQFGNFYVTQAIMLTDKESLIRNSFDDIMESISISQDILPILEYKLKTNNFYNYYDKDVVEQLKMSKDITLLAKYQVITDVLGYNASYKDIAFALKMLNGEIIDFE